MPFPAFTLGYHVPLSRYEVEIYPDGYWWVYGVRVNGGRAVISVANGRGSRGDRIANARKDVERAIAAHKQGRKEYAAKQELVIRYDEAA